MTKCSKSHVFVDSLKHMEQAGWFLRVSLS